MVKTVGQLNVRYLHNLEKRPVRCPGTDFGWKDFCFVLVGGLGARHSARRNRGLFQRAEVITI